MPLHYLCSELSKSNWARGSHRNRTTLRHLLSPRLCRTRKVKSPISVATLQTASSGPGAICDEPFILPLPESPSRAPPPPNKTSASKAARLGSLSHRPRLIEGSTNPGRNPPVGRQTRPAEVVISITSHILYGSGLRQQGAPPAFWCVPRRFAAEYFCGSHFPRFPRVFGSFPSQEPVRTHSGTVQDWVKSIQTRLRAGSGIPAGGWLMHRPASGAEQAARPNTHRTTKNAKRTKAGPPTSNPSSFIPHPFRSFGPFVFSHYNLFTVLVTQEAYFLFARRRKPLPPKDLRGLTFVCNSPARKRRRSGFAALNPYGQRTCEFRLEPELGSKTPRQRKDTFPTKRPLSRDFAGCGHGLAAEQQVHLFLTEPAGPPPRNAATLARRRSSLLAIVWHSQTTSTRQPAHRSCRFVLSSRAALRRILATQ